MVKSVASGLQNNTSSKVGNFKLFNYDLNY